MTERNDASTYIDNIPDDILLIVAEYLTAPARALFAIGCFRHQHQTRTRTPSSTINNTTSRRTGIVIVSKTTWDTLDFGQLDMDLARRLTDHDLSSILLCIDATNSVKTLKLTGCFNILGWGLYPLVGSSAVIEAIDLSMLRQHEMPSKSCKRMNISEPCVIPFLSRIIEEKCSFLKHVQFPKHWRDDKSAVLTEFLDKFEAVLKTRNYKCSSEITCDELCGGNGEYVNQEGDLYGIQNNICSECTEPFCCGPDYSCGVEFCEHCERTYCRSCCPVYTCKKCNETTCTACTMIGFCFTCDEFLCTDCGLVSFCDQCGGSHCMDCIPTFFCSGCFASSCLDCGDIMWCDNCEEGHCFDCLPTLFCSGCHATSCIDCGKIYWCSVCEEGHCLDCLPTLCCSGCHATSCFDCDKVNWCSVCEEMHCLDCFKTLPCFDFDCECR